MPTTDTSKQRIAQKCALDFRAIEDAYQCTSLQAGMLAASLSAIGNYVSTWVFDVSSTGQHPKSVRTAFESLYDQSPVLRTQFFEIKGIFLQIVTTLSVSWIEHDNLDAYLDSNSTHEIGLGDNAARFAWIVQGDNTYLVWTLHHALYDEWSINLLFDDFSSLVLRHQLPNRPPFSKFVKLLTKLDHSASKAFWKNKLDGLASVRSICQQGPESFRTSERSNLSCTGIVSQTKYQHSTLTIAVWSLAIASLTASRIVAFGVIVNGRTTDLHGIADICGPTMTTVPYVIKLSLDETVERFMISLEQLQSEILPFEQSGLDEYRSLADAPAFDTLLSVRVPQPSTVVSDTHQQLRPQTLGKRRISHPCAIYLDVVFEAGQCVLNACFDERCIDGAMLHKTLQQVSLGLNRISENLHMSLEEFTSFLRLPASVRRLSSAAHERSELSPPSPSSDAQSLQVDGKILEQVCHVAQKVSPLHTMGNNVVPQTTLRELGLDSLGAVVLARRLSETFQVTIPFKYLTGRQKSISEIARALQAIKQGTLTTDNANRKISLFEKAKQHSQTFLSSGQCTVGAITPTSILLTGATGYLGIQILRRCLISTEESILLPIRCIASEEGLARVRLAAETMQWKPSELALLDHRVRVWPSDLSADKLGLDTQKLKELQTVRTIIHNGAKVDFLLDYEDMEATNVASTAFLLATHLRSVVRPSFVYVTGGRGPPYSTENEDELTGLAARLERANGYAQTKLTSELLCRRAHRLCADNNREAQISIVHPGIVIGDERTGVANTDDFIWRYVATSIQMRAYVPAVPTKREWISITTVDSVASVTESAATERRSTAEVERYAINTGILVARFWEVVIDALGNDGNLLKAVSEREWLRMLEKDLAKRGEEHPLFSLSELLLQGTMKGIGRQGPRPNHDVLSEDDRLPVEQAITANVKYLVGTGYFERGPRKFDANVIGRSKH